MARKCPSCGAENRMGDAACSRCGQSMETVIEAEKSSLKEIRSFSFLALAMSLVGSAAYVLNFYGFGISNISRLTGLAGNFTIQDLINLLSGILVYLEVVVIITMGILAVSAVFLHRGYSQLSRNDAWFSSPQIGSTLLFSGVILAAAGIVVILVLLVPLLDYVQQNPSSISGPAFGGVTSAAVIAGLGSLLMLFGYIIGILLGIHRLATKFEEPMFDYAWITFLISLFFIPVGIVAAILTLEGVRNTTSRLGKIANMQNRADS